MVFIIISSSSSSSAMMVVLVVVVVVGVGLRTELGMGKGMEKRLVMVGMEMGS